MNGLVFFSYFFIILVDWLFRWCLGTQQHTAAQHSVQRKRNKFAYRLYIDSFIYIIDYLAILIYRLSHSQSQFG